MRLAMSIGRRSHGSLAVATSGWVAKILWSNVDPLRGSEKMKTGVGVCNPMAIGIVGRGAALIGPARAANGLRGVSNTLVIHAQELPSNWFFALDHGVGAFCVHSVGNGGPPTLCDDRSKH